MPSAAITVFPIVPDPIALLTLVPEELAGIVIEVLNSLPDMGSGMLNHANFTHPHGGQSGAYPQADRERVSRALTEAWVWLEREGLIAPRPGQQNQWVFVTRRGKAVAGLTCTQR